jgi:hypothetical protein
MTTMRWTKKMSQKEHARNRASQRYGIQLTNRDLYLIGKMIREGKATVHKKLTNSRSEHILEYQGVRMRVCYDNTRNNVCSFLPLEEK